MCRQPASWPFRGIRLIKCKCISWGRKWRGVVQIINWDVFSVKARGFQAGRPEVDLPPKWQAMASVWKRGTLVQLERKASQWLRLGVPRPTPRGGARLNPRASAPSLQEPNPQHSLIDQEPRALLAQSGGTMFCPSRTSDLSRSPAGLATAAP